MKTVILAFALLWPVLAQARLGETNLDIAKRYGAVQSREQITTNEWLGTYLFKEYFVVVEFSNNVSVAEVVRPVERRSFSAQEREVLMKSIGGEGKWLKDGSTIELLGETWVNTTTKAVARLQEKIMGPDSLMVMSNAYAEKLAAEYRKKQKAKADGF